MSRLFYAIALALFLSAGVLTTLLRADEWNKETKIKIQEPISVENTVLTPGQYVLKLMESTSDRDVVQIYDHDEKHLVTTVLATAAFRLKISGDPQFTFYETRPGQVPAVRDFFYPGDQYGVEFRSPNHP
jgi:hypothetical protein